ncbi:MAG TPA: MFS transporter [Kofleriaceae bacterium]|nr:MFS transporter [Kofleriaceae bacterium]
MRELLVRNRDFRRLFLASVVSLGGDWFSFVAVAGLVTELTGRAGAPAFVFAATVLPVFLASPIAGALADRFDRRRILVIADLARVPIALALCAAARWRSTPLAFGAVTALAVGASFSDPIASAATPNLVDAEDLASAQSLMGAVWGSMLMVGAGIGGLVAELFGRQAAFAVDAASFLASAWLIGGIRRPMQEAIGPRDAGSVRDAVGYIRGAPVVLRLVFAKGGVSSANGIVGLLPAFAATRFAGTGIATGLLFAARGLGAMIGPIAARRVVGATPGRRAIVAVCGVSTLTYCAVYAVFPLTAAFAAALVLVMCAHLGGGAQWSLSTYGLQRETPDHFRGRVLSLDYGLATLWIGASSVAAGLLADSVGPTIATWWLAAVGGSYGVIWLTWSLTGLRRL